jgi:serine/threonine protein kinase
MSEPLYPDLRKMPASQLRRVIQACERYEADWRAGREPRIEDYVAEVPELERAALRAELMALEAELRGMVMSRYAADETVDAPVLVEATGDEILTAPSPVDEQYLGRYRDLGEIGRGGMGVVHRVRDLDLHRDLALKALASERGGESEAEHRFIEEAQVLGQLQHPGVPPLHELGRLSDGRPYFTMKLIKGRTLRELLKKRPSPDTNLARFVAVFEKVAQTIAYAHSKRVLHRDLKPSNVMVGAFGEVQVMDWGLAKVLKKDERRSASPDSTSAATGVSVVRTVRAELADAETQAGSFLGTPDYIAPEQARGEVDDIDERSDVFGLGAILCEILCGRPPYVGRSSDEVRRKAARADLADAMAKLEGCGAHAELIELARACLAPEPLDRPRDAAQVARAISTYRSSVAERLRQAELARVLTEARVVQERRARRLAVALSVSVMALTTLAGGTLLVINNRYDYPAETHNNLGIALIAQGNVVDAIAEFREAIRLKPDNVEAHKNLGDALRARGELPGAIAEFREAIRLKPDNVEAHKNLGTMLRSQGDMAGAIAEFREAIRLKPHLRTAPDVQRVVAEAIAEFREAIRLKPDNAEAHKNLGTALRARGDVVGAIAEFREAIRLKPDDTEALRNLYSALRAQTSRQPHPQP